MKCNETKNFLLWLLDFAIIITYSSLTSYVYIRQYSMYTNKKLKA